MIIQEANSKIDWFINAFGGKDGWMLIACGVIYLIWFLYEGYRKKGFLRPKKEEWEIEETLFLKIMVYFGIFVGLLSIGTAIVGMVYKIPPSSKVVAITDNDTFTSIFLLVLGFFLFIKPLIDIPWASLLAILAGGGVVSAIVLLIPNESLQYGANYINFDLKWILLIVFLIISSIVFGLIKFTTGGLEIISRLISFPPITLLITLFCFIQGIGLVAWGWSITI